MYIHVNAQNLAGDIGRFVAAQESDGRRDILAPAGTPERDCFKHLSLKFIAQAGGHIGVNIAGSNSVDRYSAFWQIPLPPTW